MPPIRQPSNPAVKRPTPLRQQRWLQPLLALLGLASLSPGVPARPLDSAPVIERVPALRARLLAADAAARRAASGPAPLADDVQVAQWQKWNDWDNWAKWGKQ